MPSYTVFGASRGIGLEFVRQFAEDKDNQVFAVVRNPNNTPLLAEAMKTFKHNNVRIVKGDLDDLTSIKAAAAEIGDATGGSLDYLINNGAYIYSEGGALISLPDYSSEKVLEDDLFNTFRTNVVGVVNTINTFLPLLRKSAIKKVITLSTGLADTDVIIRSRVTINPAYAVSKAAVNMVVAQFAGRLQEEDFTFIALAPRLVNTTTKPPTPEELAAFQDTVQKFLKHSPQWDGVPLTPEQSVTYMRQVIDKVGPKDSGAFLSQFGNKQWL
ncbi:short-chain dehydrogenases/reductase [Dichomitus squalens]|uniref:Short-chain dehydrogenases/reductase n=1 Tax=Dichomitus squalens TaxID=114155 RepID=A0A4Q9PXT1_9APHY|nr:short-chain dehydrogenases/reductase [Dichomitus squalens]TBU59552.1 short-chain dehydrogenases/reductase [Dichomitus squalens]